MVNVEDSKSCKPAKSKPMERWLTIEGKKLTLEHHHIISSGDWLDDNHGCCSEDATEAISTILVAFRAPA